MRLVSIRQMGYLLLASLLCPVAWAFIVFSESALTIVLIVISTAFFMSNLHTALGKRLVFFSLVYGLPLFVSIYLGYLAGPINQPFLLVGLVALLFCFFVVPWSWALCMSILLYSLHRFWVGGYVKVIRIDTNSYMLMRSPDGKFVTTTHPESTDVSFSKEVSLGMIFANTESALAFCMKRKLDVLV